MTDRAGFIRIKGEGEPILVGTDVHIEVSQADGSWCPLRGVYSAVITILPNELVLAKLVIDVSALDLPGMEATAELTNRRSIWQRVLQWVRR